MADMATAVSAAPPSRAAEGAAPVAESERISSLDTLRGFALLGILVMNIQSFAMPFSAYFNPTAYGDLTGPNFAVWLVSHLFFDQKFMTIFSMLFGAGIILLTTRVARRGDRPARVHYRRMLWLLLIGMLHAYGIWYGDILVLYAVCGMIVYLMRNWQPRTLLTVGLMAIAIGSGMSLFFGVSLPHMPPEVVQQMKDDASPPPEKIESELASYRGGWLDQMPHRANLTFGFQAFYILIWGMWRAGGLMLVGMALYKWGVFSLERSTGFYARLMAIGLPLGVGLTGWGVYENFSRNWEFPYPSFYGVQFNYFGSLLASIGLVGMVLLVCKTGALRGWQARLAAVGRMAFTNYLLHTIICTTIFYGHGFGLFGDVTRVGQVVVVLGVWTFQLIVSPIWLRHFSMGPFEWLWRSLTYGSLQPFRRAAPATATTD